MNILEEFWYGNIEPAEYDISPSKEYKELLQLISRNEDKMLSVGLALFLVSRIDGAFVGSVVLAYNFLRTSFRF